MGHDSDDQLDHTPEYTLEEILAEFSFSHPEEEERPAAPENPFQAEEPPAENPIQPEEPPAVENPVPLEEAPAAENPVPLEEAPAAENPVPLEEPPAAEGPAQSEEPPAAEGPAQSEEPLSELSEHKVIRFPNKRRKSPELTPESQPEPLADSEADAGPESNPDTERRPPWKALLARLRKKADDYAEDMFEGEEAPDPAVLRAEKLLPGVDEERPRAPKRTRPLRPRRVRLWPDTPPKELAYQYGRGLGLLRVRRTLVFLLALPLLYLSLAAALSLPLPSPLDERWLQIWICAGVQALAFLLSLDLIAAGLTHGGTDTLTALAAIATLADACVMNFVSGRESGLPYCLISVLALGFGLWGRSLKRQGLRVSCRTAATTRDPYTVTLDEDKWDSRAAFAKWQGGMVGFGSQIQSDDGAVRVQRPLAAVLILACFLLSLLASVGQERGELFLWCLSATLCAAASFAAPLTFTLPFCRLARRLAGAGAALAGWEGIRRQEKGAGILLTDTDLFPPGAVTMNGIKVFQDQPVDKVISFTATLMKAMGGGLDRPFHELLHSQGTIYRKAINLCRYEGGAAAIIRGEQVLVGSAAFLRLMEVELPPGLNVHNAVFCAIEGELAGIFALNYALHASVRPALASLISNHVSPILATRDFNLIPTMLHQRFKLPVEKMEFPEHDRRRELSDPLQLHRRPLVCILCREGIGPLAEAVVGSKRLCSATRASTALSAIGSVVGVLLTFYLTAQMAFASLSVLNLLVFQLMWLVPTLLISGWVGRY